MRPPQHPSTPLPPAAPPASPPQSPSKPRGKRHIFAKLLVLPALALAGFAAFALHGEEAAQARGEIGGAATEAAPPKLLDPAELYRVAPMQLTQTLALSGEVRPLRHVTISAEVAGTAADVGPQPGDAVAAGAPLVTISEADYRLALQGAEASLAALVAERNLALSDMERAQNLADKGATSRSALETAKSSVDRLAAQIAAAEAQVEQARINLDRTHLTAPFAGDITSRGVEPGQLIRAGDALFSIADLSLVTVNTLVPVADAQGLTPGMEASFHFPGREDAGFPARLIRIGAETASGSRAVPVWFEIDNRTHGLRAGSFLIGEVVLRQQTGALAVPETALRQTPDGTGEDTGTDTGVMAIRGGLAMFLPVEPADRWQGGLVRIDAGLVPGDMVVTKPLSGLSPGDAVRIAGN